MSNIEEIQLDINEAREFVEQGDRLVRLHKNEDFLHVIVDGYFKEEAARLVQLKASPAVQSEQMQRAITKSIDAIGELQQYFHKIYQMANNAEETIRQSEAELEAMAEEGEI